MALMALGPSCQIPTESSLPALGLILIILCSDPISTGKLRWVIQGRRLTYPVAPPRLAPLPLAGRCRRSQMPGLHGSRWGQTGRAHDRWQPAGPWEAALGIAAVSVFWMMEKHSHFGSG
jgi:hypothetical protein